MRSLTDFQVEFDAGVIALPGIDEGFLLVPSLDASYLFRSPDADIRPYIGGGLDLVYVVSDYGGFGLPWAHLTFGVDSALNQRSSVYVEGRTYGSGNAVFAWAPNSAFKGLAFLWTAIGRAPSGRCPAHQPNLPRPCHRLPASKTALRFSGNPWQTRRHQTRSGGGGSRR